MTLHPTVEAVTKRMIERSAPTRTAYMERVAKAHDAGPHRAALTCGNIAHVAAACSVAEKDALTQGSAGNIGIITAYNDMLSAHQPFKDYPDIIKDAARQAGGTAQVASGVPAMCDGVTQGQPGMELSLFSRDIIAMAASIGLSHNAFDAAIFLGVCDKIVPGMVIAAATFGHLPAVFIPAGPMPSGIPNDEKSKVRQRFATGDATKEELLAVEMQSYHAPGTCTFYGTANTNQMLMEMMGLHLPGASFINPDTPLREALTKIGAKRALEITALGNDYTPVADVLDERAFVNGIVGLHATGGSTNLTLHLIAMARAAGIILTWQDMVDLSEVTPLMARVYPNGLSDVNHFHKAGGLGFMIGDLLDAGLLHGDTRTVAGTGLALYTEAPELDADGGVTWNKGTDESRDRNVLRPVSDPFQSTGGLTFLNGNIGAAVIKTSAVKPDRQVIEAPARIFHTQDAVRAAFDAGELDQDFICVVRFQGPKACGMPELHGLTPQLSVLQDKGFKVALVTDGRMSGASGRVPAAIHLSPEAAAGGAIAKIRDGDMIRLDATTGVLEVLADGFAEREPVMIDLSDNNYGSGRELFQTLRDAVTPAEDGAMTFGGQDIGNG